ncbi:hypothetical protein A2680_04640 [Candidatus Kaiserbacteria bacterium RIFCSPHIGHO2_01_FULL_55_37]|nr:MAG: hypothetical protein A2680_04640 [Candidatus Kaiserbacteria bacterium RIFCSPHIGHO2_01_FULL_55_37]
MSKRSIAGMFAVVLILAVAAVVWLADAQFSFGAYPEASGIGKGAKDFPDLSLRFETLAREKGAGYAFEVLKRAYLPPNTDLHLLGHTVGDELYKQKGVPGIAECTPDFRNACSHAIVVGALNEFGGQKALALIKDACSKAPGGPGAYTMCYHGLGHGVFAFHGYDLVKTVDFCRKTGTEEHHMNEYVECVGGSIMELMGGGGHDRDFWLKARGKYYDPRDPLAPCSTGVIPAEAKGYCYLYITPHLFEAAGADLAVPGPEHFAKAFTYCDGISKNTPELRQACFGGIGKEFPVLAMERDIRSVPDATDAQLSKMRTWCALAPHPEAYEYCTQSILSSLYWGGENNPKAAIRFCALADSRELPECFRSVFREASQYLKPKSEEGARLCSQVPEESKADCRTALSL